MEKLGTSSFEDFVVRLNANPPVDFAALFPTVVAASDKRDQVASEILTRAGRELSTIAATVIERLFREQSVSVAIHGGVFAGSATVRNCLGQELKSRCPKAVLLDREVDPVRGALERARREFKNATE